MPTWLSDDFIVHLTSKCYVDRVEDVTKVTMYSNHPEVEPFANGMSLGRKTAEDHFSRFDVPNAGETRLVDVARSRSPAGKCRDASVIRRAESFNESSRLVEKGAILNWFDVTSPRAFCP